MTHTEFKELRNGNLCAVIRTGEPGRVSAINKENDDVQLELISPNARGRKQWYHYTELGKV